MKIKLFKLPILIILLLVVFSSVIIYKIVYSYEEKRIKINKEDQDHCGIFFDDKNSECMIGQKKFRYCSKIQSSEKCDKERDCAWTKCPGSPWDNMKGYEYCSPKDNKACLG